MSSRAFRRLAKQRLEDLANVEQEDECEEDIPKTKAQNLFDLLNEGEEDDDDEQEDNEREEHADNEQVSQAITETKTTTTETPTTAVPSSKKSKKKNKKKKTKKTKDVSDMSMEELEEALKDVAGSDSQANTTRAESLEERCTLLSVNYRYLDAEAEMKRMFGSRVVNSSSRAVNRGRLLKKTKLATPKVDWPPYKKQGLTMDLVETSQGLSYFVFRHEEDYQDAQIEFLNAVATHNPNALMFVISRYPYHVNALLQISEVAKQGGDWSMAGDCIERAIYACERAFHPHFTFGSGTVRLSYKQSENRSFFLVLFRHVQFLARRGCWRTAFEFNKLLFSLDPENDPLGALLSIDSYALSGREYSYVVDMFKEWKTKGNIYPVDLADMPNFAFSAAYAKFKLGEKEEASTMLQDAIVRFPSVVPRLLEKLDTSGVDDQLFLQRSSGKYYELLEVLYVERCFEFFKEPEVMTWFKENANAVLKSGRLEDATTTTTDHPFAKANDIPLNISRHIVLIDIQSLLSFLPSSVTSTSYHMYDPLPPPDSESGYDIEERMRNQPDLSEERTGFISTIIRNLLGGRHGTEETALMLEEILGRVHNQYADARGVPGAFPGDDDGSEDDSMDEIVRLAADEEILANLDDDIVASISQNQENQQEPTETRERDDNRGEANEER